ncbi:hypothetical protein VULLAG_LOCUS12832 [Vulpes lagopus]
MGGGGGPRPPAWGHGQGPRKRQRVSSFAQTRAARAPAYRGSPAARSEDPELFGVQDGRRGVTVTGPTEERTPWSRGLCCSHLTDESGFQGAVRPAFHPSLTAAGGQSCRRPRCPHRPPAVPTRPARGTWPGAAGRAVQGAGLGPEQWLPVMQELVSPDATSRSPSVRVCVCAQPPASRADPTAPEVEQAAARQTPALEGRNTSGSPAPTDHRRPYGLQRVVGPPPSAVAALGVPGPGRGLQPPHTRPGRRGRPAPSSQGPCLRS